LSIFKFKVNVGKVNNHYDSLAGMGTRRENSRPRQDRGAHLPRPRPWLHQPRQDVKISRWDWHVCSSRDMNEM